MSSVPPPARILLIALALGWIADTLFDGKSLGISGLFFVLLLLAALFAVGRLEEVPVVRGNLWLLGPLLLFSVLIGVRANAALTVLNVTTVLVLLSLLIYFYAADHLTRLGLAGYPAVVGLVVKNLFTLPFPPVVALGRRAATGRQRFRPAATLTRGVLLALPVLAVFTLLLSSADSIFAGYVDHLLDLRWLTGWPETLLRLTLILEAAWVIAGGLLYALHRQAAPTSVSGALPGSRAPTFHIGFAESAIVLALVDGLFLVFAWVQFAYLFSGQAARTMDYQAYREYVRQGFGQLLVVAVLTMLLILGMRWLAWKETAREARFLNALSTLMIGLALVMLVSAFLRMVVWENVEYYINTPLRLYVRWFIVWLGLTFFWLLGTLWLRPQRFAIGAFIAALGFLATINAINPDADTAAYNLARQDELSTRYLSLLSEDAVPVLVAGLDHTTGEVHNQLRLHLVARLAGMESDPSWQSWLAFHWARWQAYTLLTGLRRSGKLDPVAAGPAP